MLPANTMTTAGAPGNTKRGLFRAVNGSLNRSNGLADLSLTPENAKYCIRFNTLRAAALRFVFHSIVHPQIWSGRWTSALVRIANPSRARTAGRMGRTAQVPW